MKTHSWLLALTAFLGAAVLGGCRDNAAGPDTLSGRAGFRVGMDLVVRALPAGESEIVAGVVDLDTIANPTDLFGRGAPSRDPVFVQSGDLDLDATTDWIPPRYWFDEARLPLLIAHPWADNYAANMDFIEFQRPDRASRLDRWDYRSDIDYTGEDNSWYAVGLARYGTQVNGLIDHLEILVNDGVLEEPDSFVLLGGIPGGYPDHQADFWLDSGDFCPPVPANANPFIMGHFKTGPEVDPKDAGANFDGETDADYCFLGSGLWQSGFDNPLHPDSIPFAPNNFESFDLPQYNYMVIWEYDRATNTVLYDRPHMRAQLGVELDLNGNPIPHAFAPFPTAHGTELGEYADFTEFLAHPRVAAGASRVDLIVNNLKPLASGTSYQVWLFDEVEQDAARIDARYVLQRPDTVGISDLGEPIIEWLDVADTAVVQGFDGAEGFRHSISIRNADLAASGIRLSQFTHAVVTLGASDASPLTAPAPAFYRYTNQNGTRTDLFDNEVFPTGDVSFGFLPQLADKGVGWAAFGGGSVQYLNVEGFAVGLSRMARPPLGYYYNVWLSNSETGASLNVGPITTPPPGLQSLQDADIQTDEQFVTNGEILEAVKWATWAELGANFADYTDVFVTLEPKEGATGMMAPSVIFAAPIPADLDRLPPDRESK